jgi:broad specificity phosphatase PhoE
MMPALPCPEKDACILYLLRHAATANNLLNPPLLQGCDQNPGLSEQGRQQASATAQWLAEGNISTVYSSPLLRATETASPIAKMHRISIVEIADLIEADVGNWAGRHWEEIARSEPDAYSRFMENPDKHPYAGGESFGNVAERILPAFDALLARHAGESIVIVGHNVVNRIYLAKLAGIPISRSRHIKQSHCGINIIHRNGNHDQLITLNAIFHLAIH